MLHAAAPTPRRAAPRRAAPLFAMEVPAGADAPSAVTSTPAAAPLPAPPHGNRKRGRAEWAEEGYKKNTTLRQREPDDDHEVLITVLDGVRRFVLADCVFVDLRQEPGTGPGKGASIDCVIRATLRGVLGGDVPAHPDAQAQRAPLQALEYGDEL